MPLRLVSLFGLVALIALAWTFSNNRRLFPWRVVGWGVGLQFAFAIFILKTPVGRGFFEGAQRVVNLLNVFAAEGARMVFGPLGDRALLGRAFGETNNYIFAISVTALIIFVSAISNVLYHWRILQRVVSAIAWIMQRTMKTSGSETLAAASNIFLGQTEAALVIKPYIPTMTRSEIMVLMVTGMSTIATSVLVVYAGLEGMSAGHILTASVLSSPSGLLIAKTMFPETELRRTGDGNEFTEEPVSVNSTDALCRGASDGVTMAINVLAMVITFVAVVALLNSLFVGLQHTSGIAAPVTLQQLFGWVNAPIAYIMGVPARDCAFIGQVLGERVVLNEFIAYISLSNYIVANPGVLDPRSVTLASYALCGFANFTSIAIQIGGIGAIAPTRRRDLAKLGFRAMIGGLLACYVTTAVVGVVL